VDYIHAWDIVLEPGETLFMPPCFWHHVEYVDLAMSFNIRFGRNRYTRWLRDEVHRDHIRQAISAKLLDPVQVEEHYMHHIRAIKDACSKTYDGAQAKYRAVSALLRSIHMELYPDAPRQEYSISLSEIEEQVIVEQEGVYQKIDEKRAGLGLNRLLLT
jgi:lysine-specific demethylase 8